MPPALTAEKTDAATFTAPLGAEPRRLLSPAGFATTVVLMAITGGVVYWVATRVGAPPTAYAPAAEEYEEVDLGQFSRELFPDALTLVRDLFAVRVVLVVNPSAQRPPAVRAMVEKRRNQLRHLVWNEIIYPKTDAELRKPDVLRFLGEEIKRCLNEKLEAPKDGQEWIAEVIFPESRLPLPARR